MQRNTPPLLKGCWRVWGWRRPPQRVRKEFVLRFARAYVQFCEPVERNNRFWVSWVTTLLVLVVCYDVFTRYLLKNSVVAVQELEWHLFAVIF